MRPRPRAPPIQAVASGGVDGGGKQRPETHLGLFGASVGAGEAEDEGVGEGAAGRPAEDVADEGGEEDQAGRGGGEGVGGGGEDLGDGVEGYDSGGAAEGEDDGGLVGGGVRRWGFDGGWGGGRTIRMLGKKKRAKGRRKYCHQVVGSSGW